VNSGFVSLEVEEKTLRVTSSELARSGGRDPDRWIKVAGEPSNLNFCGISHIVNKKGRSNPLVV
jgi:hypothetical protein